MSNAQIQTPLIRKQFIKELGWQFFTVGSDSLARLTWKGDELSCTKIQIPQMLQIDDLVVIECRIPGRKFCSYRIGWFSIIENQFLTLTYKSNRLKSRVADWSIPLNQVKRIYRVERISQDRKNKWLV